MIIGFIDNIYYNYNPQHYSWFYYYKLLSVDRDHLSTCGTIAFMILAFKYLDTFCEALKKYAYISK